MGGKLKLTLLALLAVGVLDHLYATQSSADSTVRRLGLHQDKSQASHGRKGHSHAPLYISWVILHR
jgi:hypothetical protein